MDRGELLSTKCRYFFPTTSLIVFFIGGQFEISLFNHWTVEQIIIYRLGELDT